MYKVNKILIVDLDDTLIYTSPFKKKLFLKLSQESGLSYSRIKGIYSICKEKDYKDLYYRFSRSIYDVSKMDSKKFGDILFSEIRKLRIKRKVLNYVRNFKGYRLLLTLGDRKIQKAKIDYLEDKIKLYGLFDKVKIISTDKFSYLKSLLKGRSLWFEEKKFNKVFILDDRGSVFEGLRKFSWIKILNP
ncbi:MAG: hypothetical protein KatS3mg088_309 [Patescibacteria group bacterium]|nr:MAG: hypothetical protein KatS3mg088_309 [Patescibacteria group bacterium]